MSVNAIINIQEYRVRPDWYPYPGKLGILVRHVGLIPAGDPEWIPITTLGNDFFQPAFAERNALNTPGPFYCAETGPYEEGPAEAPNNVLMDRVGQEFVFKQPSNEEELRDIISAAFCERFCG